MFYRLDVVIVKAVKLALGYTCRLGRAYFTDILYLIKSNT